MLMPMRLNSASAAGSERETPDATGSSLPGSSRVGFGVLMTTSPPSMARSTDDSTKALTLVPAVTAALSMASRLSIGMRTETTTVFGCLAMARSRKCLQIG